MHNAVHVFDDSVTQAVQSLPAWLDSPMWLISFLGGPPVTISIIVAVIIYGVIKKHRALAIAGAVACAAFMTNTLIKSIVQRDRPVTAELLGLQSFSFPSGHTAGSTIAYGLLAIVLVTIVPKRWRPAIAIIATLMIVLVGVSRVYLGAHYPSDVLGGWVVGGIGLAIIMYVLRSRPSTPVDTLVTNK